MSEVTTGSETITEPAAEPKVDLGPVENFRKDKKKRETKRREVQIIHTHVPPLLPSPPPSPAKAKEVPSVAFNAESIADRVAELVLMKMGEEVEEVSAPTKKKKVVPARPKKEAPPNPPPPPPPPTKSFGWC